MNKGKTFNEIEEMSPEEFKARYKSDPIAYIRDICRFEISLDQLVTVKSIFNNRNEELEKELLNK